MDKHTLAHYIDHTNLSPAASKSDIEKLCGECIEYGFYACCVHPCNIPLAASLLKDTNVKTAAVCGFPLGANDSAAKAYEASWCVSHGADEIDMVINIGRLIEGDFSYVLADIEAVAKAVLNKAVLKVIIECCYLTDSQKIQAAKLAVKAGAQYVKTSTGFGRGGAVIGDIDLLKNTIGGRAKIKAAGGIRTLNDAVCMIKAGADRLGCSSSVSIINEL
jgi:deoxyribose-phosphate aldolase